MPEAAHPIVIADYDPRWPQMFEEERTRICEATEWIVDIQHVGSTAVPGLAAKPIIDMIGGLRSRADGELCVASLASLGYDCRREVNFRGGLLFRKLTENPAAGQEWQGGIGRTHHLHVTELTDPEWEKHMLFRDYLRNHPAIALEYVGLKRQLATRFGRDRESYNLAKKDFIEACIEKARNEPEYTVEIADYDPRWPAMFEEEKNRIREAIGEWLVDVEHIGSTSVPGLAAKPIIDMMPTLRDLADAAHCIAPMEALGYEYVPQYEVFLPERRYFQKGYPRTHHVHMVEVGSAFAKRHISFREYLRSHPEAAAEYAALKRRLAQRHRTDRFAYTDAKSEFILGIEEKAAAARSPSSPAAERGVPATQ